MNIADIGLVELSQAIQNKKISSVEVVEHFLDRSQQLNPTLNAYSSFNEHVFEQAEEVDKTISAGKKVGLLAGVPIAVKDLFCVQGLRSEACSKILQGFVPTYTATAVSRLAQEGAIVLGKTNQDEFAMGSSNENSIYGPCKNPWNLDYVPGGSSGGSAVAVAAGMAPLSLGTDTGGSIRQPASFCNLVGLKPTYGRISRFGMIAFASSLDQAGPIGRKVKDVALALQLMSGYDANDSTSSSEAVPKYSENLDIDVKGKKVGLIKNFMSANLSSEISEAMERQIKAFNSSGAQVVEVNLPFLDFSVESYYLIATSEASSNLARYDGVRYGYRSSFPEPPGNLHEFYSQTRGEGFGKEVKRRIILGTFALSSGYYDEYYQKAGQIRRKIAEEFSQAFTKCDLLISPVTTDAAFKIGEKSNDPISMYYNDVFTTGASLAGLPAMSVPLGFTKNNLPFGLQLISPAFAELEMLQFAHSIEKQSDLSQRRPQLDG